MFISKLHFTFLVFLLGLTVFVTAQQNSLIVENGQCMTKNVTAKTDYVQILIYGQSLGMGWESPRAISTVPVAGNFMIGNNVNMQYNNGTRILSPLVATLWANGGEQPIVGCVNAFSKVYREVIDPTQQFIAMTAGEGGRTIEKLSKECTNSGYYASSFLKILDNTLSTLAGKTVSCPAILYMQGEWNCIAKEALNQGLYPSTNGTTDKAVYKALLLKLKNNMQADIMAKYGQVDKPLFFIYQTSGNYIISKEMPIVMAQQEFANENSDVVLMNPHYPYPDYGGGHLSTNGYRWFGEMMAKSLSEVLVRKNSYKTLKPTKFTILGQTVTIDFSIPVPPLVLDTLTTPKKTNYGFAIYKAGVIVPITKLQITPENKVMITCNAVLDGKIEVVYAGSTNSGSGNLRDSDGAVSIYTYFNDAADARKETYTPLDQLKQPIYGKPYGLQNWSNQFYYLYDSSKTEVISIADNKNCYLYPNPVKDQLIVKYDLQGAQQGELCIFNTQGKQVYSCQIGADVQSKSISVDMLPMGMYVSKIRSGSKLLNNFKFIKK